MRKEPVQPKELAAPSSEYSHALRVECNRLLVISGQVALDAGGTLVGKGDFKAQTHQVFKNLEAVLRAAKADFTNVVQLTIYLTHYANVKRFVRYRKELFERFFPDGVFPAETLLVITSLAYPEYLIEIEALAAVD